MAIEVTVAESEKVTKEKRPILKEFFILNLKFKKFLFSLVIKNSACCIVYCVIINNEEHVYI